MKEYLSLLRYAGKEKNKVWSILFFHLVEVIGITSLPFITSCIIDNGMQMEDSGYVIRLGLIMIAVTLVSCGAGILASKSSSELSSLIGHNMRLAVMRNVSAYSPADIAKISKSSVLNRMTGDIQSIQALMGTILETYVKAPLTIICIIIVTLGMDKSLSLIFIVAVPVFIVVSIILVKLSKPHFVRNASFQDDMNRTLHEDLIGIRLVKAYVREEYMSEEYRSDAFDVKCSASKAEQIAALNTPIMNFFINCCTLAIMWFGGLRVINCHMEVGQLFTFITYAGQVLYQILLISMIIVPVIGGIVSINRVEELLTTKPSITDREADRDLCVTDGSVCFKDICFNYTPVSKEEAMLLKHLDFTIHDKECFGIVGATGSGKTTLINLIPRLYDYVSGRIELGGYDISSLTLKELRSRIAVAPQKSLLFSGTLRENLLVGNPNATKEDMVRACKMAEIYDFVREHEDGLNMRIEEGGVNVSGGQRQRLSLARTFIKDSKLMILDDCTSALDKATEAAVINHIVEDFNDRTRILISSKMSSICRMDRILVLDGGRVSGIGTHQELFSSNKIYRDMCCSQGVEA